MATDRVWDVIQLAAGLRSTLEQEGVGIGYQGRYARITAEDAVGQLRAERQERERAPEIDRLSGTKQPFTAILEKLGFSKTQFPN